MSLNTTVFKKNMTLKNQDRKPSVASAEYIQFNIRTEENTLWTWNLSTIYVSQEQFREWNYSDIKPH